MEHTALATRIAAVLALAAIASPRVATRANRCNTTRMASTAMTAEFLTLGPEQQHNNIGNIAISYEGLAHANFKRMPRADACESASRKSAGACVRTQLTASHRATALLGPHHGARPAQSRQQQRLASAAILAPSPRAGPFSLFASAPSLFTCSRNHIHIYTAMILYRYRYRGAGARDALHHSPGTPNMHTSRLPACPALQYLLP